MAHSILQLKTDLNGLFGVRSRLNKVESELSDAQIEIRTLKSQTEFYTKRIASLENAEYKRTLAVCRAFPQTKGCKELWDMLGGDIDPRTTTQEK
jgi:hypothetical protein